MYRCKANQKMFGFEDLSQAARELLKSIEENDYEKIIKFKCVHVRDTQTGNTPLHLAVQNNNLQITEYLLSQDKTAINIENFAGKTPLVIAAEYRLYDAAAQLIEAGADVNCPIHDTTLLHLSVSNPEFVHFLITKNSNLNATDFSGSTPMHCVVRTRCIETLCMLLYYNADPNVANDDGLTPFMEAILERSAECQQILLKYVVDFETYSRSWGSILDLALKCKSPYLKEIIENGAKVYNKTLFTFIYHCEFDAKVFKLIWDNLDSDDDGISLMLMRRLNFDKINFEGMLNVIIDSSNSNLFLKYVCDITFNIFLTYFERYQCDVKMVTNFIFRMLENSYLLNVHTITKIFHQYGNCELFRLLCYFEYEGEWTRNWGPLDYLLRFMFDVSYTIKEIKQNFHENFNVTMLDLDRCSAGIFRKHMLSYFQFCADKQLMSHCSLTETQLPTVPKLVELARDASREYVIKTFNVFKTFHYYTAVDQLNIPQICKAILKFERTIYHIDY